MQRLDLRRDYFPAIFPRELFNLVVGERLGGGAARTVFANNLDPTTVIKFEVENGMFQNITEWKFWEDHQWCAEISKWIAPCVAISECGTILIQKRTEPLPKARMPKLVPAWATDLKQENYGLLGNRVVIHDYALTLPNYPTRLVKARH